MQSVAPTKTFPSSVLTGLSNVAPINCTGTPLFMVKQITAHLGKYAIYVGAPLLLGNVVACKRNPLPKLPSHASSWDALIGVSEDRVVHDYGPPSFKSQANPETTVLTYLNPLLTMAPEIIPESSTDGGGVEFVIQNGKVAKIRPIGLTLKGPRRDSPNSTP